MTGYWTSTPPSKPGAYWWRIGSQEREKIELIRVDWLGDELVAFIDQESWNVNGEEAKGELWWSEWLPQPPLDDEGKMQDSGHEQDDGAEQRDKGGLATEPSRNARHAPAVAAEATGLRRVRNACEAAEVRTLPAPLIRIAAWTAPRYRR